MLGVIGELEANIAKFIPPILVQVNLITWTNMKIIWDILQTQTNDMTAISAVSAENQGLATVLSPNIHERVASGLPVGLLEVEIDEQLIVSTSCRQY